MALDRCTSLTKALPTGCEFLLAGAPTANGGDTETLTLQDGVCLIWRVTDGTGGLISTCQSTDCSGLCLFADTEVMNGYRLNKNQWMGQASLRAEREVRLG